jgi:hypothetical protein
VRAVDELVNSGDLCICSWITLCLSTYLLTWGYCVRECMPRTGERTPTGAERPSLSKGAFGPLEEENARGPRGGSGSGRDEKPRVPRRRATGQPGAASSGASASTYRAVGLPRVTGGGATGRIPMGHPNCSGGHVRSGRHRRRHGQPGQRERRQLGDGGRATDRTEPGGSSFRATGGGASSNGAGQPATGPQTGIARRASRHDGRCDDRVEG